MPKYKENSKTISIFRVLRYILEDKQAYTIQELSERTTIPPRTIRRYLRKDLPDLGFPIEKDSQTKRYKLTSRKVPISLTYGFSIEETLFLKNLLISLPNSPLKQNLLNKIFYESELNSIAENFIQSIKSEIIDILTRAIQDKRRVILRQYHSIASKSVKDREVEPLCFTHNFTQIRAYEMEKQEVRNFSVQRIGAVKLLDLPHTFNGELYPTDPFGFSDKEEFFVFLELSEKAYLILKEEFPLAQQYLQTKEKKFYFNGFVRSYKGIGRFILSLPGEIKVVEDEGLKKFLQEEVKKLIFDRIWQK